LAIGLPIELRQWREEVLTSAISAHDLSKAKSQRPEAKSRPSAPSAATHPILNRADPSPTG